MAIQKQSYKIRGMRKDSLIGSGFSSQFAYDIKNLRLNTLGDSTTLVWTNEEGTKEEKITWGTGIKWEDVKTSIDWYELFFDNTSDWVDSEWGKYYKRVNHTDVITFDFDDFKPIGQAVIDEQWVLFGKASKTQQVLRYDRIPDIRPDRPSHHSYYETVEVYRDIIIKFFYDKNNNNTFTGVILFVGDLKFSYEYPIDTMTYFENEYIQKVYWIDGRNQPRLIDVGFDVNGNHKIYDGVVNTRFDFVPEVQLEDKVFVEKMQTGGGLFPPGTVKYLFTYYYEYGQESNVVYETSLYYPTMGDRACHPDEISGDVFKIDIYNVDIFHNYDYLRIYSIIRTTDGATPLLRNITDIKLEGDVLDNTSSNYRHVTFIDTNTTGQLLDPTMINYIGGHKIIPQTFDQKSNTLFFGNYEISTKFPAENLNEELIETMRNSLQFVKPINLKDYNGSHKRLMIRNLHDTGDVFYDYRNQLNFADLGGNNNPNLTHPMNRLEGSSQEIKYFKAGETYMFGIQFQDNTGQWSSVINLGELKNPYKVEEVSWYENCAYVPIVTCKIPNEFREKLIADGYVKARIVSINPTIINRSIIAQGVINPTVYNTEMRANNTPDVMASWFFRPNDNPDCTRENGTVISLGKSYIPFQHGEPLMHNVKGSTKEILYNNQEIQCTYPIDVNKETSNKSMYHIDRTIFTFNSAEFDFDDRLKTLPLNNPKMTLVGFVPISGWASSMYVDAEGPKYVPRGLKGNGFVPNNTVVKWNKDYVYDASLANQPNYPTSFSLDNDRRCGSHTVSPGVWHDTLIYWDITGGWYPCTYPFFPFQRNTQLNNWVQDIDEWQVVWKKNSVAEDEIARASLYAGIGVRDAILNPVASTFWATLSLVNFLSGWGNTGDSLLDVEITTKGGAKLNSKVLSHILLSEKTYYFKDVDVEDLQGFNLVDTKEVLPTKMDLNDNGVDFDYYYYGNMNTISPVIDDILDDVIKSNHNDPVNLSGKYFLQRTLTPGMSRTYDSCPYSADPVPITYRSNIHAVCRTPFIKDWADNYYINLNEKNELLNYTNIKDADEPFLWLVELKRDVEESNKFSSNHELWNYIPCGPSYRLDGKDDTIKLEIGNQSITSDNIGKELLRYKYNGSLYQRINTLDASGDLTIEGIEGDTYFMRYDCLKTVPFTMEDTNQIVEILSFMCESHINLDGRYDTNRGLTDNTLVTDTNFNYINKSYTQTNNLFQYQELKPLAQVLDHFPNQITWTKTKQAGDEIDQWTNITLANVADADGNHGEITKISNFKDNLILFQEHGIAHIGYNEKTAISTQNGVPLEIANSEKFTGFQYLSHDVGVQNKWAVSNTRNGLMFIDDHRRQMHTLGGESTSTTEISTISDLDSFWISELPKEFVKWMPYDFTNFVTYFDNISKDIYWLNKDFCIAWNEVSKSFTSFYSYNDVPMMSNVGKHFLMWKDHKIYAARENTDQYSWFFDKYEDYWMTLCCDGVMQEGNAFNIDKVFNNIEYRADLFDRVSGLPREPINLDVFNKKAAWNGYQMYKEFDIDAIRKFNTWRVQLPRATYMDDDGNIFTNRDRIRGHYSFVKLLNDDAINSFENTTKGSRMILHDIAVYFDMK